MTIFLSIYLYLSTHTHILKGKDIWVERRGDMRRIGWRKLLTLLFKKNLNITKNNITNPLWEWDEERSIEKLPGLKLVTK